MSEPVVDRPSPLIDAIPIPATLVGLDGLILDVNAAFLEMAQGLGRVVRREDRVGRHLGAFTSSDHDQQLVTSVLTALQTTGVFRPRRWEWMVSAPPRRWSDVSARAVVDPASGRAMGIVLWKDVTAEVRLEHRREALAAVRSRIWAMRSTEDIERVLLAVRDGLRSLDVPLGACGVNVIDAQVDPVRVVTYGLVEQAQVFVRHVLAEGARTVIRIWQDKQLCYRRDLAVDDPFGEAVALGAQTTPTRSVVDVPFSHGTLAVNSGLPDAFSEHDLEILGDLAGVLTEGFTRQDDLRQLEDRTRRLQTEVTERVRAEGEVRRALARAQAMARVRDQALQTNDLDELGRRLAGPWLAEMRALGVPVHAFSVQRRSQREGFYEVYWNTTATASGTTGTDRALDACPWVLEAWRTGRTVYVDRRRLRAHSFAADVQALVEIPFRGAGASLGVSTQVSTGFGGDAQDTLEEFAGVLAVAVDRLHHLAARDEAAARLRRQTEETERFFASALDLLCIIDSAGRFVRLNAEWSRCLGYQPEALQGHLLADFLHPDDREPAEAALVALRQGGTVVDFVTRCRAADGSYRPIEWRAAATGEAFYATARDISARVREEEETRIRLALQQVRNAVLEMSAPADWPRVVAAVQRLLRPLMDFRDCEVNLVERHGEILREMAVTVAGRYEYTTAKPAVRAALTTGQAVYRPNRQHPLFSPLMNPEVNSVLDVPFSDGTLALNSGREDAFGPPHIELAGRFAAVLAEGHRRLRDLTAKEQAEREVRRNEARLQSLVAILQYPAQSLQDLLDHALEEAIKLTGSRLGYIYHYDEATRQFILNSWSRGVMAACAITEPQTRYQLERTGLWGEAVRQRRPIVANDFTAPDPLKKGYPAGHAPLSRFMTVPVWARDQIVAVVGVANKEDDYTDSDVLQLTLLMESVFGMASRMRTEALVRLQAATMDNMAEGVCLVGFDDGIIRYANARYGQLCGWDPDQLVGSGVLATFAAAEHTPAETLEEIMTALRQQGEWHGEVLALRRNGTTCWCYTNASRLDHPEHGQVAVIVYSDITGRKEAEQALRQSEAALRRAQQVSRIGSWVWQIETDRLEGSDEMRRIAGVGRADAGPNLNRLARHLVHPEDRPRLRSARRAVLAGTVPAPFEIRLVRPDGTVRVVRVEAGELSLDDGGRPVAISGIAQDVTERRALEAQIEQQRLRAQQADRLQALGEMATGVAHELNQPLNGIRAFAEGLLIARQRGWQVTPETQIETLRDIIDQVDRMTAIIDHMRVFARDPSRQQPQSFALTEPVAGALRLMGAQLRVHGIRVSQDAADDLPVCVGWPNAVEQIVLNLLSNARDALDARRRRQKAHAEDTSPDWRPELRLQLAVAADRRHVQLAVADNGGGIASGTLERIFEPFFTTKEPGEGTGLGLAISLGIAERHGGRIQVENRPGDGVTFTLVLPTAASHEASAALPHERPTLDAA